ncbi:MAG: LPS assembly lipoprotein LptE [Gemmatimonadota bacterium]|nr:LPS assembly lipoprotein LptE [Gemmatimonadota bacterium]MDQ8173976.1 LPS assembly lipoprotein LptE [Gemmatimonadota bacterium]MDQ8178933.1 LPS assembly lipoprotein LptE [Gemmatimonadota bacterium]
MRMRLPGRLALLLLIASLTGCLYGFAGGGLPTHIRTVAVMPFDNETATPELPRELQEALRQGMQSRLGLRDAPEDRASAVVRGTVTRYELDIPVGFSANPNQATSARRRLRVLVDIEIVDQVTGKVLWQKTGVSAEGEYADRGEAEGRKQAIERIVTEIIEGAQSQW